MIYEKDWLMRQIQMLIQFVASLCFGKSMLSDDISAVVRGAENTLLYTRLTGLVVAGKFNEVESLLFDSFSPDDGEQLLIALDFYSQLNRLPDAVLEADGYSREEVSEGLHDILAEAGIDTLGM